MAFRSEIKLLMDDLEGALADGNRAVELAPTLGIAYGRRGFARARLGDIAGGIEDLETFSRLEPGHQDIPFYRDAIEKLKALPR